MDSTIKIPELPELSFDEKSHIYRLDGVEIPSVSKVMEPLKASGYAGISERTLERAADNGSSVHNAIEMWLRFGVIDIPEEHRGYSDLNQGQRKKLLRNPAIRAMFERYGVEIGGN